jgi:hypothetical protein
MLKTDIATDSTNELRDVIGYDATAAFEDDPNFIGSSPSIHASTESVTVQRDTDDVEDSDEEEDDEDLEDEDEEDDEEDEDDEDEDDEEDDADEVAASPMLRLDGQPGYEEEDQDDDDVAQGVDEDALDADDMDTDKVTEGWPAAVLQGSTSPARLSI